MPLAFARETCNRIKGRLIPHRSALHLTCPVAPGRRRRSIRHG